MCISVSVCVCVCVCVRVCLEPEWQPRPVNMVCSPTATKKFACWGHVLPLIQGSKDIQQQGLPLIIALVLPNLTHQDEEQMQRKNSRIKKQRLEILVNCINELYNGLYNG